METKTEKGRSSVKRQAAVSAADGGGSGNRGRKARRIRYILLMYKLECGARVAYISSHIRVMLSLVQSLSLFLFIDHEI